MISNLQTVSGYITLDEFERVIKKTTLQQHVPFDFKGDFVQLNFGRDKKRAVSYEEFTEILHGLCIPFILTVLSYALLP